MDALLPLPPEYDDQLLAVVERYYTHPPETFPLPPSILESPAVTAYRKILSSDPFAHCSEGHIWWETASTPRREVHCPQRRKLIAALALAVCESLVGEQDKKDTPHDLQWRAVSGFLLVRNLCEHMLARRQARGLSAQTRAVIKGIKVKTLRSALRLVERVVLAFSLADFASYAETSTNALSVFARMRAAFRAYGPGDEYSQEAVDDGIASILINLGRETGEKHAVIDRLRHREARAAQPGHA